MTDRISPLQTINQKEIELRRRVEEAHSYAEAQIRAAQKEARKVIARADRAGQIEAQAIYRRGVDKAQQQAESIVTTAREEAASLRSRAMIRLDQVAGRIVKLVLPENHPDEF